MTALATLLLSALMPLAAAQDAPKDAKPATDAAKILGAWSSTLRTPDGNDLPLTVEFKDAKTVLVLIKTDADEFKLEGEYKIDEKASPKTIDLLNFVSPNGDSMPDSLGVFEFKGDDELLMRTGGPGNPRPAKVGDSSEPEHFMAMKRVSKPKKVD